MLHRESIILIGTCGYEEKFKLISAWSFRQLWIFFKAKNIHSTYRNVRESGFCMLCRWHIYVILNTNNRCRYTNHCRLRDEGSSSYCLLWSENKRWCRMLQISRLLDTPHTHWRATMSSIKVESTDFQQKTKVNRRPLSNSL